MILDANLVLSGAVSAAGVLSGQSFNGAATALSTNTIDLGPLTIGANQGMLDTGGGEPLEVEVSILTAPTAGTTCKYQLVQADDAALTTNLQVINSTDDIPIASLPAGAIVALHYDRAAPYAPKRYVGLRVITVGAIATHSIFASVVKNIQDVKNIYAKNGFAVL